MNKKQLSLTIFLAAGTFIMFIGLGISFVKYGIELNLGELEKIKTNCYDRHNNIITGLQCEKTIIKDYDDEIVVPMVLGTIMIFIGIAGLIFVNVGRQE